MFDSPFLVCPCRDIPVLLDQTQHECAREHHCGLDDLDSPCPLARYFCGHDFSVCPSPSNRSPRQEKA